MADDDPDDRMLMKKAMDHTQSTHQIQFVENGSDLLDFLRNKGSYHDKKNQKPALILLDLNMPKMDGREALRLLKSDPDLKRIPVIILTTSKSQEDIFDTYDLGANSFICKPVRFQELVNIVIEIENYWLETVLLPIR
jgi:two-component system response regulator